MKVRALFILFLLAISLVPLVAQTFSDGPMNLKVRVRFVYIDKYCDVFGGNQEPRWVVKVRDDSDVDGSGWVNDYGTCIQVNCPAYHWVNGTSGGGIGNSCGLSPFNIWSFDHDYNTSTVPQRVDIQLSGWEDDYPTFWPCNGSNCSYDTGGCDNDDHYSSPQEVKSNLYYRDMGPPCQWNGQNGYNLTGYEYFTSGDWYAIQVNTWWEMIAPTTGLHTWTGYMSNDWFEPCNWNTSSVPTIGKDVYIPASATNQPIVYAAANSSYTSTGQAYCNTIEIETGADLEIQTTSGASLEVQQ